MAGLAWWATAHGQRFDDQSTTPSEPLIPTPRTVTRVTALSLKPLELQPINAGTRSVTGGEAARFKMRHHE